MIRSIHRLNLVQLLIISLITLSFAQDKDTEHTTKTPQCAKQKSPWRDFDFFIGHWEVFDPESGNKYGDNVIIMSEQGCLLMGNWINVNGGTGSSMNFYDPLKQQWRQIWQSAPAFTDQSGELDDQGRMQLKGTIYYHGSGVIADFRGTWTPIDQDRFLQEFWQYDAAADQWNVWFKGEYRRKS